MKEKFQLKKSLGTFEYYSPRTLEDAVSLLKKYGEEIRILASGTDLLIQSRKGEIDLHYVMDIKNISILCYIEEGKNGLEIGPLTTIDTILNSEIVKESSPIIVKTAKKFGTPQIRNMATIGGNICNSSPAADMAIPLITLGAKVVLTGPKGNRTLPVEDFFTGPGENVLDREILTRIKIPEQQGVGDFEKLTRVSNDLSKVSCGIVIRLNDDGSCSNVRIALGSVGKIPVRVVSAENVLTGKKIDKNLVEKASEYCHECNFFSPISDVRSTADYRKKASKILIKRLLNKLIEGS